MLDKTTLSRLCGRMVALPLALALAAAITESAIAAGPTFAGVWDMTTSQGGYFSVVMTEPRPGFILGSFQNSVPDQAGSWGGRMEGNPLYGIRWQLTLNLKQPGLGLVGKGLLTLALSGNSFTGTISESKPDGSDAVQVTVQGTRTGPAPAGPTDDEQPKPVNP